MKDYQETGWVSNGTVKDAYGRKPLTIANDCITKVRKETPFEDRAGYRSYIRFDKVGNGYEWGWVKR